MISKINIKNAKLFGTILGVILFLILVAGFTYAWFTWQSSNISISGNTECFNINYNKGQNITGANLKLFDEAKVIKNNTITVETGMAITNLSAVIDSNCSINGILTINLNVNTLDASYTASGNSNGALKYVIAEYSSSTYPNVTTDLLNGKSFSIIANGSITSTGSNILYTIPLISGDAKKEYLVIFYIDGDIAQNDAQNKSFSANIEAVVEQA